MEPASSSVSTAAIILPTNIGYWERSSIAAPPGSVAQRSIAMIVDTNGFNIIPAAIGIVQNASHLCEQEYTMPCFFQPLQ